MLGTTLMVLGAMALIIGTLLWLGANKKTNTTSLPAVEETAEATEINTTAEADTVAATTQTEALPEKGKPEEHFRTLLEMAASDGVLTPTEEARLRNFASENGLNYADWQAEIAALVARNTRETKLVDAEKEKGDAFEKYVAQKFARQYFSVLEWTGDKYINGTYALNSLHPDLKMRFRLKGEEHIFAVECKYRSAYFRNGVEWAGEKQLKGYRDYQVASKIPVFVAIGVGGQAHEPEELFLVPLSEVEDVFLSRKFLYRFRKENHKDNNLYYDTKAQALR